MVNQRCLGCVPGSTDGDLIAVLEPFEQEETDVPADF